METRDLLSPQGVILDLDASTKKQVFEQLAERSAEITGLHQRIVFDMLLERERLGSTGVGNGVAIPHARPAGLTDIHCLFVKLAKPISFDAPDDQLVDLIVLLLAPASEGGDHLRALARVARILRDKTIRSQLRGAHVAQHVVDIFANVQQKAAAE